MHKYQIVELKEKNQHAGSKAREDVAYFANEAGYKPMYIKCHFIKNDSLLERALRFIKPFPCWLKAFFKIKKNSIVLVQNPFYHRHLGRKQCLKFLKKIKKCKIVSVIHDAEFLRGSIWLDENTKNEFEFMKSNSDYEIVHNDFMKEAFIEKGFNEGQLVSLKIFDYHTGEKIQPREPGNNTADIIVAGNLRTDKSPYIYLFNNVENRFSVNLYGPNYDGAAESDNIKYHGSFPSGEVPNIIDGKFGLVWDGDSIDECSGETGNYLRYNNPHKTSLYLVSRHPVVIWKEAAMARFIENENIGICVNSLTEIKAKIDSISEEEYYVMMRNVENIAERLENGFYLKTALKECESRISKE